MSRLTTGEVVAIKTFLNSVVPSLLLIVLMVGDIESPKESVQRQGLTVKDLTSLCERQDAVRPECP